MYGREVNPVRGSIYGSSSDRLMVQQSLFAFRLKFFSYKFPHNVLESIDQPELIGYFFFLQEPKDPSPVTFCFAYFIEPTTQFYNFKFKVLEKLI